MSKTAGPVFKAIADPTRRQIIEMLAQSDCSVKKITAAFDISQPAISQHLRELRSSKLVAARKVGLERHYKLTAGPLREVFGWISQYRIFFDPAGHAWTFTSPKQAKKAGNTHGG